MSFESAKCDRRMLCEDHHVEAYSIYHQGFRWDGKKVQ